MLSLEIYGRIDKKYGPIIGVKTRIDNMTPKDMCLNILAFQEMTDVYFIKVLVNGKFVPPHIFLDKHRKLWQTKPNLKIYWEVETSKFVLVDADTKKDVYKGDMWEVERYLDEHGYLADEHPKFGL